MSEVQEQMETWVSSVKVRGSVIHKSMRRDDSQMITLYGEEFTDNDVIAHLSIPRLKAIIGIDNHLYKPQI